MASTAEQVRKEAITDIGSLQGKVDQKLRFVELRAAGHSYAVIAKDLHVSKGTLANWSRELEAEIASAKAIELEALLEEFYLLKEGRIRLLGGLLQRLKDELDGRDLTDISTDKLVDLTLRVYGELEDERVEVRPLSDTERRRLKDGTGPEVNARDVAGKLVDTLERYKAGLLDAGQARQELFLLQGVLKAQEQTVLEEKLDRIEAALDRRRS